MKYRIKLNELGRLNCSLFWDENAGFIKHLPDNWCEFQNPVFLDEVGHILKKLKVKATDDLHLIRGNDVYGILERVPELRAVKNQND